MNLCPSITVRVPETCLSGSIACPRDLWLSSVFLNEPEQPVSLIGRPREWKLLRVTAIRIPDLNQYRLQGADGYAATFGGQSNDGCLCVVDGRLRLANAHKLLAELLPGRFWS